MPLPTEDEAGALGDVDSSRPSSASSVWAPHMTGARRPATAIGYDDLALARDELLQSREAGSQVAKGRRGHAVNHT